MRLVGTYSFTVWGDGTKDEMDIRLAGIENPAPLTQRQSLLPGGILQARTTTGPLTVTATLPGGDILKLKFSTAPTGSIQVTVDALFGTDY